MTSETEPRQLRRLCRFRDLQEAGVANNWSTLNRLIDEYAFPPGVLISPNARVWDIDDVERWLAARPVARKAGPRRKQQEATV